MSRQDQFIGLSPKALELVKGCGKKHLNGTNEKIEVAVGNPCRYTVIQELPVLEDCVLKDTGIYVSRGMFDKEYPLKQFTLRDGKVYQECEQTAPWSSGPVIFTYLKFQDEVVQESLWADEEINQYL